MSLFFGRVRRPAATRRSRAVGVGRIALVGTAAAATILGLLVAPAQAAGGDSTSNSTAQRQAPVTFSAAAWGSKVTTVGHVVGSGKTALASLGCTTKIGLDHENSIAGVTIGQLAVVGAVTSSAKTSKSGRAYTATGVSHVADASLLGGAVEVTGIETTATVTKDSGGYHSDVSFVIASVLVGGSEVELTGETQVIDIPAVGTLTIAGETTKEKHKAGSARGTAIELDLLDGTTTIQLANANAGLDEATVALLSGGAYAIKAEVGGAVQAGKTARKAMPCLGTNGQDKTNSTAAVDLGDLVHVGAATATVNGTTGEDAEARTTGQVADVEIKVLGVATLRLVGVKGEVHAVRNADGTISTDLGGSTIAKIEVQPLVGGPIDVPIPAQPNTVINLPLGLGTIGFLVTSPYKHDKGLRVVAAEIDLPIVGVHATVGQAKAAIR